MEGDGRHDVCNSVLGNSKCIDIWLVPAAIDAQL